MGFQVENWFWGNHYRCECCTKVALWDWISLWIEQSKMYFVKLFSHCFCFRYQLAFIKLTRKSFVQKLFKALSNIEKETWLTLEWAMYVINLMFVLLLLKIASLWFLINKYLKNQSQILIWTSWRKPSGANLAQILDSLSV